MSTTQARVAADPTCWSCGAATGGEHFCPACGKLQPLPRGSDYFALFGLTSKLWLDAAEPEKRFHQLIWKLHQDNLVLAGEYERELLLDRPAHLNDDYRGMFTPLRP